MSHSTLRSQCTRSIAHRKVYQEKVEGKKAQLKAALDYCKHNKCRGYAALATGNFPLIKSHMTVNNLLDKKTPPIINSKDYCKVLTNDEEALLVSYIINKNRAYQALNRNDISKFVIKMLQLRVAVNKKTVGGRKYIALSAASKRTLERGTTSRSFIERLEVKYLGVKYLGKTQGNTSVNRVLACTEAIARKHMDDLAEELCRSGIMTDAEKIDGGSWKGTIDCSRVYNFDETPQFIQYDVDGTARNVHYCGTGDACTKMIQENRECVTINPMVCLTGKLVSCQVIFAGQGKQSNMAPNEATENIENLLISVTEHGYQTGQSLLCFFKLFDKYLTKKKIVRPVCVMTDGHGSRFSELSLLTFCREKQIYMFISPPDTTSVLQPLDQINSVLHTAYRDIKKEMLFIDEHLNREGFMIMLAKIWPGWAGEETVKNAFKRCGVTKDQLSIEFMLKKKFDAA